MDDSILNDPQTTNNNNSNNTGNNGGNGGNSISPNQLLLTQLGGNPANRASPFFSLLRLTSQANLQDLLNSSFIENSNSGNNSSGGNNNDNNSNSGGMGGSISIISSIATNSNINSNSNNPSGNNPHHPPPPPPPSHHSMIPMNPTEINELITNSILSSFPAGSASITRGVFGAATFFDTHHRAAKGIEFSNVDDHIFCSSGLDGKCNIYDARFGKLRSSSTISYQGTVNFSGLKFLNCGSKIALSTSSNKLLIFDIEKAAVVQSFDRCCYSGPFKTSIAMDPSDPNILTTPNITGKGLSQIDIRSPTPIRNIDQVHQNIINDITILNQKWSSYYGGSNLIMTASSDSTAKILDNQKNTLKQFEFSSQQNTIAVSPESPPTHNSSCLLVGGDRISVHQIDGTLSNIIFVPQCKSIMKLRYTHNGTKLFVSGNDGSLKVFSANALKHELLGTVYKHSRDIQDLSISKNDEYLVTASTDSKVGLIKIGEPIFGPTEFGEIL